MRYQKWGKHDSKIVCYSQDKHKKYLVKDLNCDNAKQWASDIESAVVKDLFAFSLKQKQVSNIVTSTQSVVEILNKQYDDISKKIKRLYNLYSENSDDILLETIDDLKKQLVEIQKQIVQERERSMVSNKIEDVKKNLETLRETWDYMTKQEQKNIARSCIEKIVITDNNVEIFYKFMSFIEQE